MGYAILLENGDRFLQEDQIGVMLDEAAVVQTYGFLLEAGVDRLLLEDATGIYVGDPGSFYWLLEENSDRFLTEDGLNLLISENPEARFSVVSDALSLVITGFAPTVTVTNNIVLVPPTLALVITGFAPTLLLPILVTPATLPLAITGYPPTLINTTPTKTGSGGVYPDDPPIIIRRPRVVPQPILVTPGTLRLKITGHIPTIWTTRTITTFAPRVEVTQFINTDDIMLLFRQGVLTAQEAAALFSEARKDIWSGSQYRLLEAVLTKEKP